MKRAILSLYLFLAGLFFVSAIFPAEIVHADTVPNIGETACKSVTINQGECTSCFNSGGSWTALGCVGDGSGGQPGGQLGDFIKSFLQLGTGLGGGVAFLLMLYSGFQRITSTGNPEKLHEAKELMTAAISGLLLIIFSIFLLRLIGVDILQLPEFG